jgi:hypothetical protein
MEPIFAGVPSPPGEWRDPNAPLGFSLLPEEVRYLRGCLITVQRPGTEGTPALLARLASKRLRADADLWDPAVENAADEDDRRALRRAEQAAALAAIGRAVYAALVESMRDREDGLPTERVHRAVLPEVLERHRGAALALDIEAIRGDAQHGMSESVLAVLRETQRWIERRKAPIEELHRSYESAEQRRKGRRARLVRTLLGRERRAEWTPEDLPKATALHYRWSQVRRLLLDLQERS